MTDRRLPPTLHVEPWVDPVVDALGHDPRSGYVERFWLGVLGPSAVWLLRHLADRLDAEPDGLDLDVVATGRAIGLGSRSMTSLSHTVGRLATFGQARFEGADTLAVRRRLPSLSRRQVEHLPEPLRSEHAEWLGRSLAHPDAEQMRQRARALALSLVELGEDYDATERQLHRWRFHPAIAHQAVKWAWAQHHPDGEAAAPVGSATVSHHSATAPTQPTTVSDRQPAALVAHDGPAAVRSRRPVDDRTGWNEADPTDPTNSAIEDDGSDVPAAS